MIGRRTLVNLVAVALASVVLIAYGLVQLVTGVVFDPTYQVSVRLPESGGLLADQEVTVAGRGVGVVDDVEFDGDGVIAHLAIDDDERVPAGSTVRVLRRSAIGEQALDFEPPATVAAHHEPGDVIDPGEVMLPVDVQDLIESADRLLGAIDPADAGTAVHETARMVEGRGDAIAGLLHDTGRLADTIAARSDVIDRAAARGRVAIETLADSRAELGAAIADTAGAADTLAALREDVDALKADGPAALDRIDRVVRESRPAFGCGIEHLAGLAARFAEPERLEDLETALVHNRWFFEGIRVGAPRDAATGNVWARLRILPPQQEVPESHLPEKRPLPPITPGGACASPWGPGHGPATQDDHEMVVPQAEIVPPDS